MAAEIAVAVVFSEALARFLNVYSLRPPAVMPLVLWIEQITLTPLLRAAGSALMPLDTVIAAGCEFGERLGLLASCAALTFYR